MGDACQVTGRVVKSRFEGYGHDGGGESLGLLLPTVVAQTKTNGLVAPVTSTTPIPVTVTAPNVSGRRDTHTRC